MKTETMYCEYCGVQLEKEAEFCQSCGKSTKEGAHAITVTTDGIPTGVTTNSSKAIIKCGNCSYEGAGEKARNVGSMVLAWFCVWFAPLITLIYFAVTHKYCCPKCKSTFLGIKNKKGVFVAEKASTKSSLIIFAWVFIGIAIIGLLASVLYK